MTDKEHRAVVKADTLPVQSEMHPMAEAILARNPTPETLRELMTLQREWEAGKAKRAFTEALVRLKADLPSYINRDQGVDFQPQGKARVQYRHTSLANVMDTINPLLTKHGFAISCPPNTDKPNLVSVTARLTHHAGHSEQTTLSAPADTSGLKSPAQGIASTITLLQRYAILAMLGIATMDMEDEGSKPKSASAVSDQIDTARNLKAMSHFIQKGKSKQEVEEYVGRPVSEWTLSDLDALREWGTPAATPEAREPGQDDGELGENLMSKCPDCSFKTDDPETYDGHLLGTGHGQKAATKKAKKV